MKQSTFFSITRIFITFLSLTGTFHTAYTQYEVAPPYSKFLILVETTDDGIKLTCEEGCAWKGLSFTLARYNPQAIDQNGMSSLSREKTLPDSTLANFLFTIQKTNDGVSFEGSEGTAWINLSFTCPKTGCHQYIDQNGMTSKD